MDREQQLTVSYGTRTRRDPVKFPGRRFSGSKRQNLSVPHGVTLWDSVLQDVMGCTSRRDSKGLDKIMEIQKPVIQAQT